MTAAESMTFADKPGSGTPLLSLDGVGKVFSNGVKALDNVDLTIREGDFLSLLGPSGCGKSTALRIIAGLSMPTSGGLDWRGGSFDRAGIGFVFQEPTLLPWASVFDNVWLPLRLRGVSKAKAAPADSASPPWPGRSSTRCARPAPRWPCPRSRWTSVFESAFLSSRVVVMAARPGRVFEELAVDAPYPRDEAFRTSPIYAALCREASDVLSAAMNANGGSGDDGH